VITLDFETLYDPDYSLSKLTYEEYIRDPRFEVIMVSVQVDDQPCQWFSGSHAATHLWLSQFDWQNQAVCSHNAAFDMSIMSLKFGIRPKLIVDTMSMARALYGMRMSISLKNLGEQLLGMAKGTEVYSMLGRTRESLTVAEMQRYADYCMQDTKICRRLFLHMRPHVPAREMLLIDWTIRAGTEPKLELDGDVLKALIKDSEKRTRELTISSGINPKDLRSDEEMLRLLQMLGIDWEMGENEKGKPAYGFNKQNPEFMDLLDHPDELVATVIEARLNSKSSITLSRSQRLYDISTRGLLPFPLSYCGAIQTDRWSGDQKINLQNLNNRSGIRKAIRAPKGFLLCSADLSQIELRINMYNAGHTEVLDILKGGGDVYCDAASAIYGYTVTKANKLERFVGKVTELSAGYGCGHEKFRTMLRSSARRDGMTLPDDSEDFCQRAIDGYRTKRHKVKALWKQAHEAIRILAAGGEGSIAGLRIAGGGIQLPGGLWLQYPNLRFDGATGGWVFDRKTTRGMSTPRLYGGKLVENFTQALGREVIADCLIRLRQKFHIVGTVHDELLMLVPATSDLKAMEQEIHAGMCVTPSYLPGIPLDAEVKFGATYADTK